MKILVQWALLDAEGWQSVDSSDWKAVSKKRDPTGTSLTLDNISGWVNAINVQGVIFDGHDHYAVEHISPTSCRVTCWSDNPVGTVDRSAVSVVFQTLRTNQFGAWDTHQTFTRWSEGEQRERVIRTGDVFSTGGQVTNNDYSQFVAPHKSVVRHGKMLTELQLQEHKTSRFEATYDVDFLEGVPQEEIVDGKLRDQAALDRRIPKQGTRTYFFSDVTQSPSYASGIQGFEMAEDHDGRTDGDVISENYSAGEDNLEFLFTMNGPVNVTTWPASSTYLGQFRVTATGNELNFGFGAADFMMINNSQ